MMNGIIDTILNEEKGKISIKHLMVKLITLFNIDHIDIQDKEISRRDLRNLIQKEVSKKYEEFKSQLESFNEVENIEKLVLLNVIDQKWMDHIDNMEKLRESIRLQAYAQKDPLVEYKICAYEMFDAMIESIREDVIKTIFHIKIVRPTIKVDEDKIMEPVQEPY